jgi:hypothetical protein
MRLVECPSTGSELDGVRLDGDPCALNAAQVRPGINLVVTTRGWEDEPGRRRRRVRGPAEAVISRRAAAALSSRTA